MEELNLQNIGIDFNGSFLEIRGVRVDQLPIAKTIESEVLYEIVYVKKNTNSDGKSEETTEHVRRFRLDQTIYQGAHGVVESVFVEDKNGPEILFRKVPIDGNSLECEALFQYAAYHVLKKYGLKHTIAKVRDIYRDPRVGNAAVFTMVPFLNIELLSDALENHDFTELNIVGIIAQIAIIIHILDQELDMNHRDLKTTNVLIDMIDTASTSPIVYKNLELHIKCGPTVRLVDFGFACAGNNKRTLVNAGNFFPMSDPCPKTGRDLFQLLTTMYLCTRFQIMIDNYPRLFQLFNKWLTIPNNDYIGFLKNIGTQSIDWVYLMLGSDKFFAPSCKPFTILNDIAIAFPDVVSITSN